MKRGKKLTGSSFGIRQKGRLPDVPCPVCERTMETARLYELRAGVGETIAILRGVPCYVCPDEEHPRAPSSNDFRSKLMEAVFGGRFPATRPKRFGRSVCYSCGKRLRESPPMHGEIEGAFRIDGAEMTLILTAPLVDCPHCARPQVKATPDVNSAVQKVLDIALTRGRLQP